VVNKFTLYIALILISLFLGICKGEAMGKRQEKPKRDEINNNELSAVNSFGGIDKNEAIILAKNYIVNNGLDNLLDVSRIRKVDNKKHHYGEEYWFISFSTTREGRWEQQLTWGALLVNKYTGEVKYLGEGPSL